MIKLVIFDMDGVLVESEKAYAQAHAEIYPRFGYNTTEEEHYKRWAGVRTKKKLEIIKQETGVDISYDEIYPLVCQRLEELLKESLDGTPFITESLSNLQLDRCVASASPVDRIKLALGQTDTLQHFKTESLFSSHMVKQGKPAPDTFLYAAEKMGYKPEECIVIEDSLAGIQAGKAAGMLTLGYIGGVHRDKDFTPQMLEAGADHVFEDMRELPELIKKLS